MAEPTAPKEPPVDSMVAASRAQRAGDFATATPLWEQAVNESRAAGGKPVKQLEGLAFCAIKSGDKTLSLIACDQMESLEPGGSAHHWYRGITLELSDDRRAALDSYHLALMHGERRAAYGIRRLSQ